jgi:DNA-binding HxlR family transcriptional regulator
MCLIELKKSGFIKETEIQRKPRLVRWELTQKRRDVLPILMSFIAFGSKWYPGVVFQDKQPRTPEELSPKRVKFEPVIKNI